ncbi:uncharacterized protein F4812DRAFT_402269 [Daldinia caldariorum]|uniref:uncharacterized protein n=1 Tax=Daldinia caldariorum TaxID=326644 RepID=UPI002008124E|nr:uncharacterized protein F4812DRAFT_402269 [Daldinia caldariorum]KAI1467601.1 hypothetical protein F4812DRAFT_402269 [Daldinia caldariorum]
MISGTMKLSPISLPKEGWRRTGLVNLACTCSCGILLLAYLVVMMTQRGSALNSTTIILEGECQKTRRANSILHILISVTSTLILASSRFFMQILSSPSRLEINRAHVRLRSLEIGISSVKNLRFLSIHKTIGWAVLLISSTSIHLLFNSSVWETHFRSSEWHLTVASSSFSTLEVDFFPPGASLANAGCPSLSWNDAPEDPACRDLAGYGEYVALEDYWDKKSAAFRNITKTANESKYWQNITSSDCRKYYASCRPKEKYRDVVIVVDTQVDNPGGWTRTQVFRDPSDVLGLIWDLHMPIDDLNSLWYSTQCSVKLPTAFVYPDQADLSTAYCINSCGRALGFKSEAIPTNQSASPEAEWILNLHRPSPCSVSNEKRFGYNDTFNHFPVRYCLAEPSPISQCYVGLSNILLLITISCVFIKALVCALVVSYLPNTSLVTLGDALESFIADPDPVTSGLGTFNVYDSYRIQSEPLADARTGSADELTDIPRPRVWKCGAKRLISVVPRSAWSGTLVPIVCFACVGMYYANQLFVFDRVSL